MKTIAIANQKGGCGKTTTAMNLAASLALDNKSTLIIDLDPQAHATIGFGITPSEIKYSMYDVMIDGTVPISRVIRPTSVKNLFIAPATILLSGIEIELANDINQREYILSNEFCNIYGFDFCIIDCSPSLNIMTLNALVASDHVLIPVQAHYYAMEGLKQLLETIDIVRERYNQNLSIKGILLTFMEERTNLCRDVYQQMKDFFGDLVLETVIHRSIRLAEAPSAGQSVITYDNNCKGAMEYMNLAKEISNEKQSRSTQTSLVNL